MADWNWYHIGLWILGGLALYSFESKLNAIYSVLADIRDQLRNR